MELVINFLIILGVFIFILFLYVMITLYRIFKPPKNAPKYFLKKNPTGETGKKKIVFIGDSITHATVSENYIKILSKRLNLDIEYINAGINGDLTFNVLQRMDEILQCKPDIAIIFIGTNDANGSLSPEAAEGYIKDKKLPTNPEFWSEKRFKEDLTKIVKRLSQETSSKIAILSIPPMGEISEHFAFKRSISYSEIIKEVANENNITYLALNEEMREYLKKNPTKAKIPYEKSELMAIKAAIAHYFGKSWENISKKRGFRLLTDNIHLNNTGASIVADLIENFYNEQN